MSALAHSLTTQAMQLPEEERAGLAAFLLRSLDQQKEDNVEQLWKEEVHRRLQNLMECRTTSIPWIEARERLEHLA